MDATCNQNSNEPQDLKVKIEIKNEDALKHSAGGLPPTGPGAPPSALHPQSKPGYQDSLKMWLCD